MMIFSNQNTYGATGGRMGWCRATMCGLIAATVMVGSARAQEGTSPAVNGQLMHEGQSYRVVDASSYMATGQTENSVAQVAYGSCNSCGTSCGGSCGNTGGLLGLGLLDDRITNFSDDGCNYGCVDPCGCCEPFWYGSVEALYMDLDGGDDRDLGDFFKDGFDMEAAGRYTMGYVPDCVHGIEASYTGLLQWNSRGSRTDPGFGLNTLITPVAPLVAADISAFNNASLQREIYTAQYWSAEVNRAAFAGDMAKVLFGLRYVDYEENFRYFSQNATETGFVQSRVDNQMLGAQFGLDLLYPICRRGYTDFRTRFAGFLNSYDTQFRLVNDGTFIVRNFDDSVELAGIIEVGGGFRYRLGNWQLRAGGEFWYFYNLVDAPGSFRREIDEFTGSNVDPNDFFMAGLSLGAQLTY